MAAPTHTMPLDDAALAWLALALVPELLPRRAFALVERFGTPRAVLDGPAGGLAAADVPPAAVASLGTAAGRARAETLKLARAGATLVAWSDDAYPPALRHIAQPPLVLAVRGSLGGPDEPAIAIVGARRASEYGRHMAAELARQLAQAGVTVVSGLAAGVDAAAHHAALAAGGRTVAVLGTGIDRVYPKWHRELARAIAGQGALVSEFPCGSPPLQFHFPRRNRIISGLTRGTIVVEAADDSGSLITARHALEQDRQVFAVPGPVGVPAHHGPNRPIQQGAKLVLSARDVIVESPAKAKTLGKYLGRDYQVKASIGHVMDLPKSKLGVDIERDFAPEYHVIQGKAKVLEEIKKAAQDKENVYLAPDPDREGEAIAWHIAQKLGRRRKNVHRVMFNEITKKAVLEALKKPGKLDQNRFDAQQARRILDRLVGYKLSPLLWDKVRRGLSAGRVQSVAVRIICEREREIRGFTPEEYWTVEARLEGGQPPPFAARLAEVGGQRLDHKSFRLDAKARVEEVLAGLAGADWTVTKVERKERRRHPTPPFITSRLQQEASRKLGFQPSR